MIIDLSLSDRRNAHSHVFGQSAQIIWIIIRFVVAEWKGKKGVKKRGGIHWSAILVSTLFWYLSSHILIHTQFALIDSSSEKSRFSHHHLIWLLSFTVYTHMVRTNGMYKRPTHNTRHMHRVPPPTLPLPISFSCSASSQPEIIAAR